MKLYVRNKLIFKECNIIPRDCFDCFKVVVELRNVVDLFKLMMIFERLDKPLPGDTRKKFLQLPDDNIRKCMVEIRPRVQSPYKGFIYCQDHAEAKQIRSMTESVVAEEISPECTVRIKRGCTEYELAFPEYTKLDSEWNPLMPYKEEWRSIEEQAAKDCARSVPRRLREVFDVLAGLFL